MSNTDEMYIGEGIPDEYGADDFGPFAKTWVPVTHIANCGACGKRTEVIVRRNPDTDDEEWYGLCCDHQGDTLSDDERFPFGR